MPVILDIVIAAILVLSVINGVRNGFVKTIIGLVIMILSAFIAFTFSQPLAEALKGTELYSAVKAGVDESIEACLDDIIHSSSNADAGADTGIKAGYKMDFDALEIELGKIQAMFPNANIDAKKIADKAENYPTILSELITDSVVLPVTDAVFRIICFILIYALSVFILKLLSVILDFITRLPLIKTANKLLGGVAGAAYGVVWVYVICFVTSFIVRIVDISWLTPEMCDASELFGFFSNLNIFSFFL